MSGELRAQHVTGATLYAVLVDANGGVWNGAAFDPTPTSGEWATYDIAMVEAGGSGYYLGDLPGVGAGRYECRVHKQLGGSPAATDPVVWVGDVDTNPTPAAALTAYDPPTHAELTAGLAAGDDAVLAAIAGLNNLSSAQVSALLATADDATLAAIAALNDLSSAEVEALIAGGSGATPETFWNYDGPGGRTLTMAMIAILSSMIEGTSITITRGDTYSIPLVGLGNLAGRTGLWFTVKAHPGSTTDADAKIQVTEAVGLVRLNGASAQAGGASITVNDEAEGDITIHLTAATTAQLGAPASWRWDVQVAQPGPGVWTPRAGAFLVDADVTRATS